MSSSPSLRDLYNSPSSAWSFIPAPPPPQNSSPSSQTYTWSTRPAPNSIFDLSPALDPNDPSGFNVNATLIVRSLIASALLQYTSTAIAMPWEVGKLLLQVQWVPRDVGEREPTSGEEEEEVVSDSCSENESYFTDPNNTSPSRYPAPRLADDQGYVVRRSVHEEGTRPEYVIPVGSADGVWGMMKRIARFRGEGWLALWKGLLTSCVHDVLATSFQPLIHNLLQTIFYPGVLPLEQPPLLLGVGSHVITGLLLSPLDLVRTRLIVQSFMPRHRTYSGPVDALVQIVGQEGGVRGVYLHPHLLIPAVIDSTLRPVVALALPGMVGRYCGLGHTTEDTHPIGWLVAEFVGSCVGLLVTLPFETVRRRLQVQVRGTGKGMKTCVETRRAGYNGVVDTLWHVLREERSDVGEGEERWMRKTGIGQLYRGLGMRLGASAIVLLLGIVTGGEERDGGGWAEL